MSTPKRPDPAKLVISLFMNDQSLVQRVLDALEQKFGRIDMVSPWFDFDYTDYYHREMGSPLFRRVVVFKSLVEQERLADIKTATNKIEAMWKEDGKRAVNIDPGYLVKSRFILATGKDFAHRVYIGQGIYADLTLMYQKGRFIDLDWTYPDYRGDAIKRFLEIARAKYCLDFKKERSLP
jgi:hypothetical protein